MDIRNNLFRSSKPATPPNDPRISDPRRIDPRYNDPRHADPRLSAPRQQGGMGPGYSPVSPGSRIGEKPMPSPGHRVPVPSARQGIRLNISKIEGNKTLADQYIFRNICAVSPLDFPPPQPGTDLHLILNGRNVVTAKPLDGFPRGSISLHDRQRTWCDVGLLDSISAEVYDPFAHGNECYLGELLLEVGFAGKKTTDTPFDQEVLSEAFIKQFENTVFAPEQQLLMDYKNIVLGMKVKNIRLVDLTLATSSAPATSNPSARGILMRHPELQISFVKDNKSPIKFSASAVRAAANSIISPDFKFEDMGIGGLDAQFSQIFRRAFASRTFPPLLVEKLGIRHVKGIILHGPPGTGKTLIARQIGKVLNSREPKVVNGPEILNKFVGQSEENIRKLFADAEKEYKEKGDESGLHTIIFDEIDAICKQRGSGAGGGTGVGDSIVNQLLSKLDGVDQLNNILVIGMTNRIDMIDEALLRPGRLEVKLEIPLPDEAGRVQILNIHVAKMEKNKMLGGDVDVYDLASRTPNFSGAEIQGLVTSATSFAMNRHIKVDTVAAADKSAKDMKVTMSDFTMALAEVKSAFGAADETLDTCMRGGILRYNSEVTDILKAAHADVNHVENVKNDADATLLSLLLHGGRGSGKTALAAKIAKDSGIPYIKVLSPDSVDGWVLFSESAKVNYIQKVFTDAYKSPRSIIIMDEIERTIEYVPIGPYFSRPILTAVMTVLKKQPPPGCRLLIIGTTTKRELLRQLDIEQIFDREQEVPNVNTLEELASVLRECRAFESEEEIRQSLVQLQELTGSEYVGVGIKRVLLAVDLARQAEEGAVYGFALHMSKIIDFAHAQR